MAYRKCELADFEAIREIVEAIGKVSPKSKPGCPKRVLTYIFQRYEHLLKESKDGDIQNT